MEVTGDEAISGPILVFMLRHGLEVSYNSSNGWLVPVLGGYGRVSVCYFAVMEDQLRCMLILEPFGT